MFFQKIYSAVSLCCLGIIPTARALSSIGAAALLSPNQRALGAMPPFPRTWVPLASVYELDGARPNRVEFLGQSYVCFQSDAADSTAWTVLDDACPHRLAPLSEGRVISLEGANASESSAVTNAQRQVECSYHGWAFDRGGRCVRIPQATPELESRTIGSNPKCHVKSYSTRVCKNILFAWLWPEDCLAFTDVDGRSVEHAWRQPEYMVHNIPEGSATYTRDLPYGWDTLLENIVDPAHVPWAHHGLQGSRQDAIAINMTTPNKLSEQGLTYSFQDRTMGMMREGVAQFRAPYVISYGGTFQPKPGRSEAPLFNLTVAMFPKRPGWSRIIIYGQPGPDKKKEKAEAKKKKKTSLFSIIFRIFPPWLLHQFSNRFLDSDLALLHYQEQERLVKRRVDYDGYCMPAPADRCIAAMRRWIQEFAHIPTSATVAPGDATQPLLPPSPIERSELFDRWAQHSDQCKHCHGAVDTIKKWRRRTYVVMAAGVVMAKFLAARALVIGCVALLKVFAMTERSMKKGGFDHYKNL